MSLDAIGRMMRKSPELVRCDKLKAWQESIYEAGENEVKFPKLKVGMSTTVDLESNKIETTVRFTTTYQTTISTALPDPNQPEIPGLNTAKKAAEKFVNQVKKSGASVEIIAGEKGVIIADGKVTAIKSK